jgi:hypothetical protein
MKLNLLFLGLILCCSKIALSQQKISITVGASVVSLELLDYSNNDLLFVNLHNNEVTSIQAIKQVLLNPSAKYLGILSGGTREVNLSENGRTITFDPNRIYTKTGIEKTLKNYHCNTDSNFKVVEMFSKELLKYFSKAKLLVAVHNNSDGGFSINSILKDMKTKKDAKEIFVNPNNDEDDFYYVTEKSKFDYFKIKGYNVVLQDNKHVENDGSLSVYCGRKNISYINIECQNNHLDEQIKMIQEIYKGFVDVNNYK